MGEISKSALLTLKRKISCLAQAILICHIRNTSLMHLFIAAFFLKKQLLGSHLKMVQNPPNHYLDTLTLPSENKCTMSTLGKVLRVLLKNQTNLTLIAQKSIFNFDKSGFVGGFRLGFWGFLSCGVGFVGCCGFFFCGGGDGTGHSCFGLVVWFI